MDQFNSASITDVERSICACHLNPQFYQNIQSSLNNEFPGSKLVAEPSRCLFPPCVDSSYKTNSTGKICPLPACVNIAAINNNGSITGGGARIIQSGQDCANISKPGGGNEGPVEDTKTWIEKHWVWVVLGISLLIVLIIVILIVIAAESNKKKKK